MYTFITQLGKRGLIPSLRRFHTGHNTGSGGSLMVQSKADIDGIAINYDKTGNGSHPVLCMPGALGFIESDFGPILPKFNHDKFTIITWDPPGYGKSRPPDRDFTGGATFFHRDAEWANGLMHKLGYKEYSIVGWSDGANTGLVMAVNYSSSIKKLVVFGGNSYISETDVKLYNQVENIDSWSAKMKAPMIDMYGEEYFRKSWSSWVALFRNIYEKDGNLCKDTVKDIKCPTLIIHGMKDPMVPFEHAEYLHKNIPNSKLHVMNEGKHNLHLRYPEKFIPLVQDFLLN